MKILNELVQSSPQWLDSRVWKISGTKLASVMAWKKAVDTFMFELLSESLAPLEENFISPAMERWTRLEPYAIIEYERKHNEKVEQPWLIIADHSFSICSPDWIIANTEGKYTKALEIKCLGAKKMLKYMLAKEPKDIYKIEKTYYWQIVNYFICLNDLEELTFFLYNPDMYEEKFQIFEMVIKRDQIEKDIAKAKSSVLEFEGNFNKLILDLWV